MNNCTFTGRLTKDPVLEENTSGFKYVRFTLAISRGKVKDGAQRADFIPFMAMGKTAEIIANYMRKGSLIEVTGRLESRDYETQDGYKRTAYSILVNNVGFLESRRAENEAPATTPPPVTEEAITADEYEADEGSLPFDIIQ